MREMVSGYDNGFGRGRAGDVETIRALGAKRGFHVEVVPPTTLDDGRPISIDLHPAGGRPEAISVRPNRSSGGSTR